MVPPTSVADKFAGRIRGLGIADIDEMVGYAFANRSGRFGGADVHAPIDQRRIDADDLERQPLGKLERKR
jgi:hypothetical protein